MPTIPPLHPNQVPRTNSIAGVSVREDILFTNHKGEEKGKLRKDAIQALEKLQVVLPRLLEPQETVLYVSRAMARPGIFEQVTGSAWTYVLRAIVLVITDRRILRFRAKGKGLRDWTWDRGVMAVRWSDLTEAKVKGWLARTLTLKYRDGKKEVYMGFPFGLGKKLKLLVDTLMPGAGGGSAVIQMEPLCPECLKPLTARVYQCGGCGLPFKDEKGLLWRNFLLPGGGFFYTGWKQLGLLHAFTDCILLFFIASCALLALRGQSLAPNKPGDAPITPTDLAVGCAFLVLLFALENSIMWMHNRRLVREFIPAR